jgi:preprotein translocase subunit SecE
VARGLTVPRRDCFVARLAKNAAAMWALRGQTVSRQTTGGHMANPFQFLQDVRSEASKVVWPTRRETLITTGLVVLMVLFASLFFVLVDKGLHVAVGLLLRAGQ